MLRALAERGAEALRCRPVGMHEPRRSPPCRRGCLRLSRHRAHEPARGPPPRRHRRGRPRVRRAVGARSAAAARRGGRRARRRDRCRRTMCTASARAWAKLPQVAAGLLREGVSGARRRRGDLARARRADAPRRRHRRAAPACGRARRRRPAPMRSRVLGSAGRGESLLAMDQDNALVFAEGAPDGPEDRWFGELGVHIADILHEVGVPYCKGGVMAKNPPGAARSPTWRDAHRRLDRPLAARRICCRSTSSSTCAACTATRGWRRRCGGRPSTPPRGKADFAKLLAEAAGSDRAGPRLASAASRPSSGRIDLKKAGLFGIVTAARALADPPSRRRALDAGAARRHQGARHRRRKATSTR